MASAATKPSSLGARIGLGIGGAVVALLGAMGSWVAALVALLALLGTPLFAIMGGSAELAWLTHPKPEFKHLSSLAPRVIDPHFSDSPILVTIPLFTFVGYVLAEAKTPDRLVAAARAVFGWMPGGLAIVCVVASAIFTVLTGGSGVTIIAIGGLLYPALRKQKYSEAFSLGLVTTGGSVGLLLPYSLPLLVYALVANIEFEKAFKAVLTPGLMVIGFLAIYSMWVGIKEKVEREPPRLAKIAETTWELKWELLIPVILIAGLQSKLTAIDESAGLVALYVVAIEFFVYKDLSWKKDLPRIVKASMSLAGAIILILAMANSLMHYVSFERIPAKVLEVMLKLGIEHRWQFLIVMNLFLLVLGMLMEGFSAILVAVPLILPFVADLGIRHPDEKISPFQMAMIFLLNLELAYCVPPLGLNLFISSFRFNRPVTSLYKVVLPFVGILLGALLLVSYVPWISNVGIKGDIAELREKARVADEKAKKEGLPIPSQEAYVTLRHVWKLECVQDDPTNPQPCSPEDRKNFPGGQIPIPASPTGPVPTGEPTGPDCNPELGDCPPGGGSAPPKPQCNPELGDCPDQLQPQTGDGGAAPEPTPEKKPCNPELGDCP